MSAFMTRIQLVRDPGTTFDTSLKRQEALLTLVAGGVISPLAGNAGGDINMGGFDLLAAGVVTFAAEYDNGDSGAAKTILLTNGMKQKIVVTADTVLTISTVGAGVGHYQLRLVQDTVGAHAVTFDGLSPSRWLGSASAPAANTAAEGETLLSVFFDGTNMVQSLTRVGMA